MRTRVIAGSLSLSLILLGAISISCREQNSRTKNVVRVSVNSWVGFAPLFVAAEQGIFKKNGLDVEINKTENAPDRRAALIAGRVDIVGSTVDDLAVSLSQGVDAVAISCADYSNGSDAIIGAGDVNSLEKLAKSPVAVQPGFVNHFFLLYVLDSKGIDSSNITVQPMTPDDAGTAFIAGNINAAVTWEPHISQALKQRSGTVILASSKDYPEAILDIFIANKEWYNSNRKSVDLFAKSWDEAVQIVNSKPNDAMPIVATEIGVTPDEAAAMLSGAKLMQQRECHQLFAAKGEALSNKVQKLWAKAGYLKGKVNVKDSLAPIMNP